MYLAKGSMIRRQFLAHSTGARTLLTVLASSVLLVVPPLSAQSESSQEIPTVEPALSRLFGSDDLRFGGGAISPDGRWLVFNQSGLETDAIAGARAKNMWIAPLDGPGDPTPLTWGSSPLWFPSGDRILFRMVRPDLGGVGYYLMTLDIDPATGQAKGMPRQLTVETAEFAQSYDISPDGQEVAYVTRQGHVLKILPARGGQARTVGTYPGVRPIWADDGFIYLLSGSLAPEPDVGYDRGYSIRRVQPTGGEAEIVSSWPGVWSVALSRDARTLLYRVPPRSESSPYEVGSVWGERWARVTLPQNMTLESCFQRDVLECLASTTESSAPLKLIPINGGPIRQLTESQVTTLPLGWTPDGREVVFDAELDGTKVLMSAPLNGGVMEELHRRPVGEWVYGPFVLEGQYVLFGVEDGPDAAVVLRILDLQTGSEREVSHTPWVDYTAYNSSRTDDRFLYAERKEGRFEFLALKPEGDATLLRAFPDTAFPPIIAVHGDRIAYWTKADGGSTLYLARAGRPGAQRVLTFPGSVGLRGDPYPKWSPDGRYLATGYWRMETNEPDLLVVEIDESGEAVGEPWVLENLPDDWWGLRWMPDSEGFLVVGENVWLASIHRDEPPVNLTQEETGSSWTYQLSPDGRYIAFSPNVRLGGSIWRVDLEEVLAGHGY